MDIGLAKTDDRTLWNITKEQPRLMVSKDEDFLFLATRPNDQGRLLWLRLGNCRKQTLLLVLENNWPHIEAAFTNHQRIVEVR
ncbi:hypothetical protein FEM03_15780 [Phragmitibacter flavus]|uniref:DUF5615 domain-containing protein n=1 Tax=Phragmitibacter flavus TaxID=2576071 RepID=A0A5R8KBU6_9BACT|nr:hypothetical protein FEM03_15780 [Phragmitibacter flavus]